MASTLREMALTRDAILATAFATMLLPFAAAGAEAPSQVGEKPGTAAPEAAEATTGAVSTEEPRSETADDGDAPDRLVGEWSGTWKSTTRGETGRLNCTIYPQPSGKYRARFRARFWRIFTFKSTVLLTAERGDEAWAFTGKADLGRLAGGVYTYDGTTDGETFTCTYEASGDKGSFEMKREAAPARPKPPPDASQGPDQETPPVKVEPSGPAGTGSPGHAPKPRAR